MGPYVTPNVEDYIQHTLLFGVEIHACLQLDLAKGRFCPFGGSEPLVY